MSIKFVQSGIKKYLKEKWDEAEEEFIKAVEANDISPKGWYYLGMCRVKQNDGEGANVCFKKAMAAAKVQEPEDIDTSRNSFRPLRPTHTRFIFNSNVGITVQRSAFPHRSP